MALPIKAPLAVFDFLEGDLPDLEVPEFTTGAGVDGGIWSFGILNFRGYGISSMNFLWFYPSSDF
jgi:hypothetical protein